MTVETWEIRRLTICDGKWIPFRDHRKLLNRLNLQLLEFLPIIPQIIIKKPIPHRQHVDAEMLFRLFVESCLDKGFLEFKNWNKLWIAGATKIGAREQSEIQIPCFHQMIDRAILVKDLHQWLEIIYIFFHSWITQRRSIAIYSIVYTVTVL